jgi:uncharacterized OsmC-like protein
MVHVRPVAGKTLSCSVRDHVVITDRKREDGGSDAGCTSGELLLMAIGSCAMGSLRNALSDHHLSPNEISAAVELTPAASATERDGILITVSLAERALAVGAETIARAATSGGVVSRISLGSVIAVRSQPLSAADTSV